MTVRTLHPSVIGVLAALSFGPAALGAQQTPAPNSAVITGVVVDSDGAPLGRVTVTLVEPPATRVTEADGTFRFVDLPRGTYVLQTRGMGYLPTELRVELGGGETQRLTIALTRHPLLLDAILVEVGETGLRGVVHDAALQPIPGAEVSPRLTTRRFRTDDDGWFGAPGLPPGRHLLRVSAEGFDSRFFSVVIPEDSARVVSIQLQATSSSAPNLEARDWRDYSQRMRWGSRSMMTILTREDLDRRPAALLSDIGEVRHQAGNTPCVRVNGRPTVLPLDYFFAIEVEAVDVIPQDALFLERQPFSRRGTLSRSIGPTDMARQRCTAHVYVWLPSD
jgi:hypothetical protein